MTVETPQEEMSRQAWSMTLLSPPSGTGAQMPAGTPWGSPASRSSDALRRDGETSLSSASGPSQNRERAQFSVLGPPKGSNDHMWEDGGGLGRKRCQGQADLTTLV